MNKGFYYTIKEASKGKIYKEKNSKFYGYAFPINSKNHIPQYIKQVKSTHHSAQHFCYAYQIGETNVQYRVNDDGEPKNSAGMPIYGQILAHDLTNILIVVVRYFGGVKLGVSGLINAYKTGAKYALD